MSIITGTESFDSLLGSTERDVFYCKDGDDTLTGDSGDDVIYGDGGSDLIFGGADSDILLGNSGDDSLEGGKGNDVLYGDLGNDYLRGGLDNDRLFGGSGKDTLTSDSGVDILSGGADEDTFIFGKNSGGLTIAEAAIITDFNFGVDLLSLTDGLTFEDIKIYQGTEKNSPDTIISLVREDGREQFLVILKNVDSRLLVNPSSTPIFTAPPDPIIPDPIIPDPTPGILEFTNANFSLNEDGTAVVQVQVKRTGGSDGNVGATLILNNGTAASPQDYNNTPINITFSDGDSTTKNINIPVINDTILDGNKTVNLSLQNAAGGATIGDQNTATLTILDDEIPNPGSLQFSAANFSINEDGTAVIPVTVTRGGGTTGAVSATIQLSDASAISPDDYNNSSITINFADGDNTPKTINIPIVDDLIGEENENLNLSLINLAGGATLGNQKTATLTILDDEIPNPGILQFSAANFSINEDGTAVIPVTVTRGGGTTGAVSATIQLSDASAISPDDYNNSSITINFADGDNTPKTINIPIVDDLIGEENENFNLSLINPAGGATIGNQSTATLTILDDEIPNPGSLQFSAANFSINEDGTAVIPVTVTRGGGTNGAVSATIQLSDETAISPDDYNNSPITINFADGDNTPKTINIPIFDDVIGEENENLNLSLINLAGGATIGNQNTASLKIIDNEAGEIEFVTNSSSQLEGNPGSPNTLTAKIRRINGSKGEVTAQVIIDSTPGTANSDDFSNDLPVPITFADGDTAEKEIVIPLIGDSELEADETINLRLFNTGGGAKLGSLQNTTLTLLNDDVDTTPPTAIIGSTDITQGGETTYQFRVQYFDNVDINLSSIDSNDIIVTSPNNINLPVTLKNVTPATETTPVTAIYEIAAPGGTWDLADNGNYTIQLQANQVTDTNNNSAISTQQIFNVNAPLPADPNVTLAVSPASVAENSNTPLVYTFTRSDSLNTPLSSPLTISYTLSGTALTSDNDFVAPSNVVTFAANSATATVNITPTPDYRIEPDETVILTLDNRLTYTNGTPNSATGTIQNDDRVDVTTLADNGDNNAPLPGSLREALIIANNTPGAETITFTNLTGQLTLLSSLPAITDTLTIAGYSPQQLIISAEQIYSEQFNRYFGTFGRIFTVNNGITATFKNLTITGGYDMATTGTGIYNNGGTVNLINSAVTNNFGVFGAGIYNNSGTLNIANSTLDSNGAQFLGAGGGIYNEGGSVSINNSTISNNFAENAGGIYNKGGGNLTIINSTISGNRSIWEVDSPNSGGGILNAGTLNISNSTLTNNFAEAAPDIPGSGEGAAIFNTGTASLRNTIIGPNPGNSSLKGTFTSQGYNLITNQSGATITPTTGDQIGTPTNPIDPKIGPLQDNGGPTFTHALLSGSPAINAGNPNLRTADQNKIPRSGTPDMGAVENNPDLSLGTSGNDSLTGTRTFSSSNGFYYLSPDPDIFLAGLGNDTLTGNGNNDTFMYTRPNEGTDTITDFNTGDKIQITSANFNDINNFTSFFSNNLFTDITITSVADTISSHELIIINTPGVNTGTLANQTLATQTGSTTAGYLENGGSAFYVYTNSAGEKILGYDPDIDNIAGGVYDLANLKTYTPVAGDFTFV